VIRIIGALSVVVALVGVIAVFAKGSGSSSSSNSPGTPPIASPTASLTTAPSVPPMPTPSPSTRPGRTHSAQPRGTASPLASAIVTGTAAASPSTTPVATSPAPQSHPTSPSKAVRIKAPTLGAYSYVTTGGDKTNLPGTSHTYPATTTVRISKAGCGVDQTWTPDSDHSETQRLCIVHNRVHLASYSTSLTFFGQHIKQNFSCAKNAYIYSPELRPGSSWSFTCTTNGAKVVQQIKAVGFANIDVGKTQVRTIHLTVNTKISGGDSGTSTQSYWIATRRRPIMVRNTAQIAAKQGGITYSENYTIQLKSLRPH
jgi:hypothetical protein